MQLKEMCSNNSYKVYLTALIIILSLSLNVKAGDLKSITVAGITDKIPVEYKLSKSSPTGIYVELWKIWSRKTGIPVSYIITSPEEAEAGLKDGAVDVIMGYVPGDNSNLFSMSDDIYLSSIYIYRNKSILSAEKISELPPYIVGVTADIAAKIEKSNYQISFFIKKTVPELLTASEEGEINVFIAEDALAAHELRESGLWRKFTQSAEPVFRYGVKAAVRPDNKDLLQIINSGFSRTTETEKLVAERTWAGGNFKYRIPWGFIAVLFTIASLFGGVALVWWWNFQLHRKIGAATAELTILKEEAEAASVAKSRFLDNISHELRTPLTLILAPVEDALSGKTLSVSNLEMIQRNGRNLLSLINDLLDISRITAGGMNLEVAETDLCSAVKLYCAGMESAVEHKGIELCCSIPDYPVMAYIDVKKFSRVISNFFSNSFKFTKAGGKITIGIEKNSDCITLEFSDTGAGIPPSKIDSVFNLFTQGGSGLSESHAGTGIGLAIVKEIAGLHGGSVSVESRYIQEYPESHGTVFSLNIPCGKEHFTGRGDVEFIVNTPEQFRLPFALIKNPHSDNISTSDKNKSNHNFPGELPALLIAEDNVDMLRFLETLLSDSYKIYTASNGIEALDILKKEESIDLIISDVMMPDMDGYELVKRLRNDANFESIPVLFLTARGDDYARQDGLKLGAVDYVTKPFNSEELKLRIKNQMDLQVIRSTLKRKNDELNTKLKQYMEVRKTPVSSDVKIKIETICGFIKDHFADDLNRENLASAADMNPDTFSRTFNQYTGKTLGDYVNELRINEAKKILAETDASITRICHDTGFDSIRTFNRTFRKFTGTTPGEFRDGKLPEVI
jgi:signal transduction histidine kinase/AraC-like DNA-binding protein